MVLCMSLYIEHVVYDGNSILIRFIHMRQADFIPGLENFAHNIQSRGIGVGDMIADTG